MLHATKDLWRLAVGAATVAAVAASLYGAFAPVYRGSAVAATVSVGAEETVYGSRTRDVAPRTLPEVNGPRVYLLVILPIIMAAFPMVLGSAAGQGKRSTASALLLVGFVFVTGFSIGLLYAPAALLAISGAVLGRTNAETKLICSSCQLRIRYCKWL